MKVDRQDVGNYQRQGAVALRGIFADWIETLRRGIERNMADPGPFGTENVLPQDGGGRFFDDYCNWQRIPEFTDFMRNSPAAAIAGALMGSTAVQVFHDHVLVKEPGTPKPTPWHQDMPYYCVDGMQTASYWIPLDPVTEENTLRLVVGSHLWPKLLRPTKWAGGEDFYDNDAEFMDLPDIDGGAYSILAPALEPGDAIVFNYRTSSTTAPFTAPGGILGAAGAAPFPLVSSATMRISSSGPAPHLAALHRHRPDHGRALAGGLVPDGVAGGKLVRLR
jgi:ectoine hydroxylase-related dioxygenase (phytanoyl-CoA dioxygenase family)